VQGELRLEEIVYRAPTWEDLHGKYQNAIPRQQQQLETSVFDAYWKWGCSSSCCGS
jgi:hypothetical protein